MEDLCRICLKKCLSKKTSDTKVISALDDIFDIKVWNLLNFHMKTFVNKKILFKG